MVLIARRLACAPWWSRHGSRAPRQRGPITTRCGPPRGAVPTPSCTRKRSPARASSPSAARGAETASRSRCPPASPSPRRCTPACCSAPSPCRSTCAWRGPSAITLRPAARCSSRSRSKAATPHSCAAPTCAGTTSPRPLRSIHTSGTTSAPRPIELTYGNLLWSALGSAVALGSDPSERWLCALPLSHVGGLSILLRSAIYATGAVVHERFETDRVLRRPARRCDAREPRRDDARTAARRRAPDGRRRCAVRSPAAARCRPRCSSARDAGGVPVGLTYGLTETCSQVTTTPAAEIGAPAPSAGPPLFCTRVQHRRGRRDPRARPDRGARGCRRPTAGCTPATSAASTSAGACTSAGARPTRSSAAARTSRRPRSRRCSRPSRRAGGSRGRARGRALGRGRHGDRGGARGELGGRRAAARALPARARAVQGAEGARARTRAAAAHALGQAAAPGAADELRRQRPPRREPRELGRGGRGLGAPAAHDARVRRAGLALDDRRDRPAARPARARARRRARRDGTARRRARRADGQRRDLRPGRGDARGRPRASRRARHARTSSSRCSTPNGSTCRSRASTPCCAAGATC